MPFLFFGDLLLFGVLFGDLLFFGVYFGVFLGELLFFGLFNLDRFLLPGVISFSDF